MSSIITQTTEPSYGKIKAAVEAIQARSSLKPELALVLGSGLGAIADEVTDKTIIPYSEIPGFHPTSIIGHAGRMILGKMNGIPIVLLDGRFHRYEGYPMEDVVLPTRVVITLGVKTLVLTNAAGGINTRFRAGDVMLIEDHLNLTGENPLVGKNLSELGPRFPDLTEAYSKRCLEIFQTAALETKTPVHKGVYGGLLGPSYETPSEVRMLRILGADAVGMSTVSECIAANHMGIEVAGLSCITNLAAGLSPDKLSHDEVLELSKIGAEKMKRLLLLALPRMALRTEAPAAPSKPPKVASKTSEKVSAK
ncbi:MAG: purine-nucleoside phosphorylase [Bdellovibrionia bacterium]